MRRHRKIPLKGIPKFVIVVEGECEFWYIQMLKRNERLTGIDLKPEIPQRKKLSEQYRKVIELSGIYDRVYWVIDFDIISKETREAKKGTKTALQEFKEYYYAIRKNCKNVVVLINNPCFEYWLLLHFEYSSGYYGVCREVIKPLKKYLPDYEKTQAYYTRQNHDIYLKLREKLPTAILNAKKLNEFNLEHITFSVSDMHLLFDALDM